MVAKQIPGARLVLAGGAAALLAACSSLHGARQPGVSAPQAEVQQSAAAPSSGNLTATQAAIDAARARGASAASPATSSSPPEPVIKSTAPMTYTVKRGDTLWAIASKFLRDPWDWPEVWYINPQIKNPHLIYPGDVLQLAYGRNGQPQIRLLHASRMRQASGQSSTLKLKPRLRSSPVAGAIPTIPYAAIASFLTRPTVLTAAQVRRAPHIIAFRNQQQVGGNGSVAYVSSLGRDPHTHYSVVHVGEMLRYPHGLLGHNFGYLGTYTATALIRAPGDPGTVVLTDAARETFAGDRLIANDARIPLTFEPRAPSRPIHGKIIWVVGGTGAMDLAGQYDIVVLNRGTQAGLVPGDVLAADHEQGTVRDTHSSVAVMFHSLGGLGRDFAPRVKLPAERAATLLVFKAYRRLSFALVVTSTNTLTEGDPVHDP